MKLVFGDYMKLLFREWDFSGARNKHFFAAGQDSSLIYRVCLSRFEGRAGQSIHDRGNKQDERK